MKRRLILAVLFLLTFAAGFYFAWSCVVSTANFEAKQFRASIKNLRQHIYGDNQFHYGDIDFPGKARLAAYDPATSQGSITLTTCSIWQPDSHNLQLRGDGGLYSTIGDKTRLITTITPEQCKGIFQQFLTSGILNFSKGVVDLKKDLSESGWSICDAADVELRISVPELAVEKRAEVYAPDFQLKHYPDIIEFQIFTRLEQVLLDLVPAGDPEWRKTR